MTKSEYREKFRLKLRDNLSAAYLWSDDEVDSLVQAARTQAAMRSKLIPVGPRMHTDISVIPLVPWGYEYQIDPTIFLVKSVSCSIIKRNLEPSTDEEFDTYRISQNNRVGTPQWFYIDDDGMLILDKAPDVDNKDTLTITGFKRPYPLILDDDPDLEITDPTHQEELLYHAYSVAYQKQDSEAEHVQKSQYFAGLFNQSFRGPVSADSLRRKGIKKARYNNSGWF